MPRIKLAYWHGTHKPGDEIDVSSDELALLQRDGRVAEILGYESGGTLEPGSVEAVNESSGDEAVEPVPPSGRKRR